MLCRLFVKEKVYNFDLQWLITLLILKVRINFETRAFPFTCGVVNFTSKSPAL